MSFPATSNVQYRLKAAGNATILHFHHTAMGLIPDDVSANVSTGWDHMLQQIRVNAKRESQALQSQEAEYQRSPSELTRCG